MKNGTILIGVMGSAIWLNACGATRDVDVTGDIKAATGVTLTGPVRVEIIDRIEDGDAVELVSVDAVILDKAGEFEATVALEGTEVLVRAVNDTNNDAACSEGEAWAEAQVTIADDDTAPIPTLELAAAPCPEPVTED